MLQSDTIELDLSEDNDLNNTTFPSRGRYSVERQHISPSVGVGLFVLVVIALIALIFTFVRSSSDPGSVKVGNTCSDFTCTSEVVRIGAGGFVTSTNTHATRLGLDILKKGGTAADAAVAVQLALGFAQPQSTGIGGGLFALYYHASSGEVTMVDGREEAPASAHPRMFCRNASCFADASCICDGVLSYEEAQLDGLAVGVPGTVAALHRLHRLSGVLKWADVVRPVAALAREGIPVVDHFARVLQSAIAAGKLTNGPARETYFNARGAPLGVGDVLRNLPLANTYNALAIDPTSFYGSLASVWVDEVNQAASVAHPARHGRMTMDDARGYRAVLRDAVRADMSYGATNITYYGAPFPSAGGMQVALTAGILSGRIMTGLQPNGAAAAHHILDAQALAFADRQQWFGDADFVDIPKGFTTEAYWAERRGHMRGWDAVVTPVAAGTPSGAQPPKAGPAADQPEHGTTHFIVADAAGNVACVTTTIEANFGSGIVSGLGFIFNNEMTDFDLEPPDGGTIRPNSAEGRRAPRRTALGPDVNTVGGKRPRSTMAPSIAILEKPVNGRRVRELLAVGSPGGASIASTVATVFVRAAMGASIPLAVAGPRVFSRNLPQQLVTVESWAANGQFGEGLRARNFTIDPTSYLGYCEAASFRLVDGGHGRNASASAVVVADSRIATAAADVELRGEVPRHDCVSSDSHELWDSDLDYGR